MSSFVFCFAVPFYKPALVLQNTLTLHLLRQPVAPWPGECITLRGRAWWDGRWEFRTKLAEPYPPALGARYGHLMRQALEQRRQALTAGEEVPFARPEDGYRLGPLIEHRENQTFQEDASDKSEQSHESDSETANDIINIPDSDEEPEVPVVVPELVPYGLGAPKHLAPLQHVEWAKSVTHPSSVPLEPASEELREAIDFECSHSPEEIDDVSRRELAKLIRIAWEMKAARAHWVDKAPQEIRPVVERIHGPLM